jgi:hypothetical protein
MATPFLQPVNPEHYPTYRDVIDSPMDLGTIEKKVR